MYISHEDMRSLLIVLGLMIIFGSVHYFVTWLAYRNQDGRYFKYNKNTKSKWITLVSNNNGHPKPPDETI